MDVDIQVSYDPDLPFLIVESPTTMHIQLNKCFPYFSAVTNYENNPAKIYVN